MKCTTIRCHEVEAGIATQLIDGRRYVVVGEEGRGRTRVAVPVPPGAVVSDNRLDAVAASSDQAAVVLLLIEDASGFRGGLAAGVASPWTL